MPEQRLTSKGEPIPIKKSADDALKLTDNFIYYYRCASHSAGNGRQIFEVPSFLALVGTTTAAAFGAGKDVVIAGGAANATLDGGKDYYSPLQKAAIYDSALDAYLCIKSVASGTKPFAVGADDALSGTTDKALSEKAGYFSAERQFFEMVSAALFSVERVAGDRIRNSANYDPAGVVAQIKNLSKEVEEKKDERDTGADQSGLNPGNDATGTSEAKTNAATQIVEKQADSTQNKAAKVGAVKTALSELDIMQSELQLCVVRAKL